MNNGRVACDQIYDGAVCEKPVLPPVMDVSVHINAARACYAVLLHIMAKLQTLLHQSCILD